MDQDETKGHRLLAACLLGFVLFNYPLLAVFNVPLELAGIPVPYLYLFIAWGLVIALLGWIAERN